MYIYIYYFYIYTVIRLDNMNLLRELYLSAYYTSSNLKNLWCNSLKTDAHFKEQALKKAVSLTFQYIWSLFYKGLCIFSVNFKDH